ncbi:fructosamine kinase family protein [Sphingomonas sp.]|uniref:fructosamine kinase family protein n=1 Tax=Sphingomonas sp. TaxID=28214 RepID=UPI003B3ADBAA
MTDIAAAAAALLGVEIREARPLAGGDLSAVVLLSLADGRCAVAKSGEGARREGAMLAAIAATGVPAPAVLAVEDGLLVMEHVPAAGVVSDAWDDLARALGLLHAAQGSAYGWDADHAFGSVLIANAVTDDWPAFWGDRRLRPQIAHVDTDLAHRIERLADRLADLLPAHPPPSLLHGDLWGGNVLAADGHVAALIDPACYYGHREVDVAMLTLFDAPPRAFFDVLDLEAGWQARLHIYRLWPLLVHLRLFGSQYQGPVAKALATLGY